MDLLELLGLLAAAANAVSQNTGNVTVAGTRSSPRSGLGSAASARVSQSVSTRPVAAGIVQRNTHEYWEERGWQRKARFGGRSYTGYYRTPHKSVHGAIDESRSGGLVVYIDHPPAVLREHPHWICFSNRGDGRYYIHFRHEPKDIDSAIMAVERIIREAYEGRGG